MPSITRRSLSFLVPIIVSFHSHYHRSRPNVEDKRYEKKSTIVAMMACVLATLPVVQVFGNTIGM
ncbi:hypothetical protein BS47DRAFT_1343364, partial [Hydnum rufescens UP504]